MLRRNPLTLAGIGLIILAVLLAAMSSPEKMNGLLLLLATVNPQVRASIWNLVLVIVLMTLGSLLILRGCVPRQYRYLMLGGAAIGYTGYLAYLAAKGHLMLLEAFYFNTFQDMLALALYGVFTASLMLVLAEPKSLANVIVPVAGYIIIFASQFQFLYGPAGSPIGSPLRTILFMLWAPALTFVYIGVPFLLVNTLRLLFDDLRAKKWLSKPIQLTRSSIVTGVVFVAAMLPVSLGGIYAYQNGSLQLIREYPPLAESLNLGSDTIERSETSFSENQIHLVDTASSPCRDENGNFIPFYWAVFTLENENKDHYVDITGFIDFLTSRGDVAGRLYFDSLGLPTDGKLIFVDANMLKDGKIFNIEGGEYTDTQLAITSASLGDAELSPQDFHLESELVAHQVNTTGLPQHSAVVNVVNAGRVPIYHTKILAAVYNSSDELVDILWSERVKSWPVGKRLKPGESLDFDLNSVSNTGGCLGETDANGYKIEYYISGMTATGETLGSFYAVETGKRD